MVIYWSYLRKSPCNTSPIKIGIIIKNIAIAPNTWKRIWDIKNTITQRSNSAISLMIAIPSINIATAINPDNHLYPIVGAILEEHIAYNRSIPSLIRHDKFLIGDINMGSL